MSHKPISLKEFKNWLAEQKDLSDFFNISRDQETEDPNEKYVGCMCRSKVSEQKLLEKIEADQDAQALVGEFIEEGGTIVAFKGKKVQIEVDSGTFTLPRFCIKIRKDH